MLRCDCHGITLEKATIEAVVRVRTAIRAFQMSCLGIKMERRLCSSGRSAGNPFSVSPWTLETLVLEYLCSQFYKVRKAKN